MLHNLPFIHTKFACWRKKSTAILVRNSDSLIFAQIRLQFHQNCTLSDKRKPVVSNKTLLNLYIIVTRVEMVAKSHGIGLKNTSRSSISSIRVNERIACCVQGTATLMTAARRISFVWLSSGLRLHQALTLRSTAKLFRQPKLIIKWPRESLWGLEGSSGKI